MQRLLIFLIILFSSCSTLGQNSLIGTWKPVKVTIYNAFSRKTLVVYDDKNRDSLKRQLLEHHIREHQEEVTNLNEDSEASKSIIDRQYLEIDMSGFKKTLNSDFKKYESAKLIFNKDSSADINSYGLLTPSAVPGWTFGDRLIAAWTLHTDRLKLTIGEKKDSYSFFYKIIKLTGGKLILGMTTEDYKQTYMTLEFVKQ